jgi:hypothetical protein
LAGAAGVSDAYVPLALFLLLVLVLAVLLFRQR